MLNRRLPRVEPPLAGATVTLGLDARTRRRCAMNKRSAMTLAGGVVGAMVAGVAGYAVRLDGVQAAGATTTTPSVKPVVQVRTITTTIKIKKKPKA